VTAGPVGPRDFWKLCELSARRFKQLEPQLGPKSRWAALQGVNVSTKAWLDACERELRRRYPRMFA